MHQALELYCVHTKAAAGFRAPRFEHDLGKTVWNYRGQLTPKNERLDCEVHVKKIEKDGDAGQDEVHKALERVQSTTDEHVKTLDQMADTKTKEIMTV